MSVKLLAEHHLEFLNLKGGCTGSSESTLVKMSHCWKSHVVAQITIHFLYWFYINRMTSGIKGAYNNFAIKSNDKMFNLGSNAFRTTSCK